MVCPIHQIDRHLSLNCHFVHCYSNVGSSRRTRLPWWTHLRYNLSDIGNQLANSVSTVGKRSSQKGLNEIQIITTRADVGEQISDGWFRLSLHHKGLNDFDPETATMTDRMPYNASALEVKYQLDMLANIQFKGTTTHVTRSLVDAQGGYRWAVSFELGANTITRGEQMAPYDGTLPSEDIPLLILQQETISATWTGGGQQVHLSEVRKGSVLGGACEDTVPTHAGITGPDYENVFMGTPICKYTVTSLQTNTHYHFRVRAHNLIGGDHTVVSYILFEVISPTTTCVADV